MMKALQKLAVLSAGALSVMNMAAVLPAALPVSAEEQAECTWSFDEDTGTLTISGPWGNFYDERPWDKLKNVTKKPAHTVVFENMNTVPAYVLDGFKHVKTVKIPEGTEFIGEGAFQDCTVLESVTLPDSLECIGACAFENCKFLETVSVPSNVSAIGSGAFRGCTALRKITLPEKPDEIGPSAFEDTLWLEERRAENPLVTVGSIVIDGAACKGAVQIPEGTTDICYGAFKKNGEITAVTFPESLKELGGYAFAECGALEQVVIPKQVKSVGDYAFYNCENLKSVVMEEGVTVIGDGAFVNCDKLTDITIPESVNRIETYSLNSTPWMEKQQKENPLVIVNNILVNAVACKGSVVIPETVVRMSPYAFSESAVTSVVIPEGIQEIPFCAFSHCENLTSVTIPETVERIVTNAFNSCDNLKELTIPASVKELGYTVFAETDLTIRGYTGSAAEAYAKEYEIPFVAIGSAAPKQEDALCGDANSDGTFDIADAVLTARYMIADKTAFITDTGKLNADVTGDGEVLSDDVTAMLQFIAKKILIFPAEEKNNA